MANGFCLNLSRSPGSSLCSFGPFNSTSFNDLPSNCGAASNTILIFVSLLISWTLHDVVKTIASCLLILLFSIAFLHILIRCISAPLFCIPFRILGPYETSWAVVSISFPPSVCCSAASARFFFHGNDTSYPGLSDFVPSFTMSVAYRSSSESICWLSFWFSLPKCSVFQNLLNCMSRGVSIWRWLIVAWFSLRCSPTGPRAIQPRFVRMAYGSCSYFHRCHQ